MKTDSTPLRIRFGELGSIGLRQYDGAIYEEEREELRFPEAAKTYKRMACDPTVAAGLALMEAAICSVDWYVDEGEQRPPSREMRSRAQFLRECMGDMEHSWASFVKEITSSFVYGFAPFEKIFRQRLLTAGSKYNDGMVGWRAIPIRSQDTIVEWKYSEDGRRLTHVVQDASLISNGRRYVSMIGAQPKVEIPIEKIALFRTDAKRDNPEGQSILKAAWYAWRKRVITEEIEAVGLSRDLNGLPVMYIPPRYMSPDASDNEKAAYTEFKNIINNIQCNEQGGAIIPQVIDPESKAQMFKFELLSTQGGKAYDTSAIIKRYDDKILTCLFGDMLTLGQNGSGSHALASAKSNINSRVMRTRLNEIMDVFNTQLVPQLFALNGIRQGELPTIRYKEVEDIDLDVFSKAVQRMMATGAIEFDREVANKIRRALGVTEKDLDEEIDDDARNTSTSRSGDGMEKGMGNGTSDNVAEDDSSVSNTENS